VRRLKNLLKLSSFIVSQEGIVKVSVAFMLKIVPKWGEFLYGSYRGDAEF
jgi:hypothetical protein